jgi:cobalamin synthase
VLATGVTVVAAATVAGADSGRHVLAAATGVAVVAVAVGAGFVVRRSGTRAFGGLTGDVLGATIACATTTAYVVVALTGSLVG